MRKMLVHTLEYPGALVRPIVFACFILTILSSDVCATSTPPRRENMQLNSETFTQPEYVEALAKELEKESAPSIPTWWLRLQRAKAIPSFNNGFELRRNLDHIGGGRLLRRELDTANTISAPNVKRNLDKIGGGHLLRDLQYAKDDTYSDYRK